MAEIVRMPKMSDTMTEGVVAKWHKKVGDTVKSGDLVAEIETDKATMEFESFQEGVLLYQGIEEGKAAPVDAILAILGKEGEDYKKLLEDEGANGGEEKETSDKKSGDKKKDSKKDNGEVKEKESGDDDDTKEDSENEEEGTEEEEDTEQAESTKKKPTTGKESDDKKTDVKKDKEAPAKAASKPTVASIESSATDGSRIKASPLAKKLAADKGIDLSRIMGSGGGGRVVKRDIDWFKPGTFVSSTHMVPGGVTEESFEEITVSQMRKTIAKRLAESKFTSPHFYLTMEITMDRCIDARESINAVSDVKISFNDFVIKAAAAALQQHPKVNSSWLGDRIRINHHIHIGVAVAVDEGLLVPVVRFADSRTLSQINTMVKEFAQKAKDKKLQPADWEGNTFTISNLGMFGIDEFTAIINPPDACILAVGGIKEIPVIENGQLKNSSIMKVTLSCDHRVVDGVTGAKFLQTLKGFLENPVLLLGQNSI